MIRPPVEQPGASRRALLLALVGAVLGALLMLGTASARTDRLPEAPPGPEVTTLAVTP